MFRRLPTIRGDFHVHSSHSGCDHPAGRLFDVKGSCGRRAIVEMTDLARRGGMEYFALVNHASDPAHPRVADRQTNEKIIHHLTEVLLLNAQAHRNRSTILAGVEASVLPDGQIDVDDAILSHLDVVIVSRHGGPPQLPQRITASLLRAMENPHVDIIGHPTRYLERLTLAQWEALIRRAVRTQTAIEFNLRQPFRSALARVVASEGALVALGSDTHRETRDAALLVSRRGTAARRLLQQLLAAGVRQRSILNLKPLPAVLAWLRHRRLS